MLKFTQIKTGSPVYINPSLVISVSNYRNTQYMMDCTGIRMSGTEAHETISVDEGVADVAASIADSLKASVVSLPAPASSPTTN